MHLIAVIGFVSFGVLLIALAIAHEYSWWMRRGWRKSRGTIIGITEKRNADGVGYYPEIQFEGATGISQFVSKYGSGMKPTLGVEVDILIDKDGHTGEQITVSNRTLLTIVPIVFGLLCIVVGLNVEPLESTDQDGADKPATAQESKPEDKEKSKVELE